MQWHRSRAAWLALGLVVGLTAGGFLPHAPMHAIGTDRTEGLAMCTVPLDNDLEGVFFLDFITGQLGGLVLNPTNGQFAGAYQHTVMGDLQVDASKNPRYTLLAGGAALRPAGVQQFAPSVVYVAEATTGNIAAYAIPFNRSNLNMGRSGMQTLQLLQMSPFRAAAVR